MTSATRRVALFSLIALLTVACGQLKELPTAPDDSGPPDPSATFTRVQNEIFTPTCATSSCHSSIRRQGDMSLAPGEAYTNIVNVAANEVSSLKRVDPTSYQNSYMYRKVTRASGIVGDRMPQGLPPLPDAQIALLKDWIRRGAPND